MKIEMNSRTLCTGNSRHVNIRYFFVNDRVDKGKVDITYCPPGYMLANILQNHYRVICLKVLKAVSWVDRY